MFPEKNKKKNQSLNPDFETVKDPDSVRSNQISGLSSSLNFKKLQSNINNKRTRLVSANANLVKKRASKNRVQ